jgi:hypothetical protein
VVISRADAGRGDGGEKLGSSGISVVTAGLAFKETGQDSLEITLYPY